MGNASSASKKAHLTNSNSASQKSHLTKDWLTPIKVGGKVPSVEFILRVRNDSGDENPFEFKTMTSEDLFKGKRVVLFALPGAFTPTCSSKHVPGYVKDSDEIKSMGVDDIFCLSVNDAFVMRQWGLKQGMEEEKIPGEICFNKVKFLPDGNAHFTRGMGLSCMFSHLGFGERSWRYSVVINDLEVEKIFIEGGGKVTQNPDSDPYEVSDSTTMLEYLKSKKEEEEKKEEKPPKEKEAVVVEKATTEETPAKEEEATKAEEPKVEETPAKEEEATKAEEPEPKVQETPDKEEEAKPEEKTAAEVEEEEPKAEKEETVKEKEEPKVAAEGEEEPKKEE